MNVPYRDWTDYPRRFPFYLQVSGTHFLKGKEYWIRRSRNTVSISFIFRGRGEYYAGVKGECGPPVAVEAPCVLVRGPGVYGEYGPFCPADAWDELYFTYEPRFVEPLLASRLVNFRKVVWPMGNPGRVWTLAEELAELVTSAPPEDHVDAVDRICERTMLEAFSAPEEGNPSRRAIKSVLIRMRKYPRQPFDIQETARLCGMSEATFRRRWSEVIEESPRRYQETLRLQEARRLLVESEDPVKAIAHSLGFEDELYFSRRFQRRCGLSPREYRERHRRG